MLMASQIKSRYKTQPSGNKKLLIFLIILSLFITLIDFIRCGRSRCAFAGTVCGCQVWRVLLNIASLQEQSVVLRPSLIYNMYLVLLVLFATMSSISCVLNSIL